MKFISKNQNLRIVLRPGIEGNRVLGTPQTPGKYARFQMGLLTIPDTDEESIRLMLGHPGFNSDFIKVDEGGRDPYVDNRTEPEPDHEMVEIKYGTPGKRTGAPKKLPPKTKKMIVEMANKIAVEMVAKMFTTIDENNKDSKEPGETIDEPKMVPEVGGAIENPIQPSQESPVQKRSPGRPKRVPSLSEVAQSLNNKSSEINSAQESEAEETGDEPVA